MAVHWRFIICFNIGSSYFRCFRAGASGNMPLANFEILASLILILFGWVFVPFI